MKEELNKFITKGFWILLCVFVIRCLITMPNSLYDCLGFGGEAIAITFIILMFYEKFLWKFDPFERVPKIMGQYKGKLEYCWEEKLRSKQITVKIKQTLLKIDVKIITNEVESNTITSDIAFENGDYVLYYTYITNPKSKYSLKNPIQYGTCRIILKDINELEGQYWTSRKTTGDLKLKKVK